MADDLFESEASLLTAGRKARGGAGEFVRMDELAPATIDDDVDLVRALLAEFLGCFFLVLCVLGAVYGSAFVTSDTPTVGRALLIALTYGFALAAALYAFTFPSADRRRLPNVRHLNPAVTFALVASFKMHIGRAMLYWMSQVCGAGVAVLAIFFFTPFEKKNILTAYPLLDEGVSPVNTWLTEGFVSFVLILVVLMACFGHLGGRQPSVAQAVRETSPMTFHEVNSIMAGLTAFVCCFVASPVSGGYMNPLMAIGIGILSGNQEVGAYVMPLAGAAAAVLVGLIFGFKTKFMYFNDREKSN